MSTSSHPLGRRLAADAADIDLRCALAFSRSTMKTLAVLSPSAHDELDRFLVEEIEAVVIEEAPGGTVVEAILEQTRTYLAARREEADRIRRLDEALGAEARRLAIGTPED